MDEQTLGRKLIEWAADEQNVLAPDILSPLKRGGSYKELEVVV